MRIPVDESVVEGLPRDCFRSITLYDPDVGPCEVDLSDNTNLWGVPPAARHAIESAASEMMSRYPAPYASELKREIARYLQVEESAVVTGCGSDDVLDSAIRAFGTPGDRVAIPDPSFGMIPVFARVNGLQPVFVPLDRDGGLSPANFDAIGARITYLCSPNNPTGVALRRTDIDEIVSSARGLVIVDQAYAEFSENQLTYLVGDHDNVLITRTMSKAFGLAGLRVGYAIGSPALVREVEKSRGPYKVNALAARAAAAALRDDLPWVANRVAEMKSSRARFIAGLARLGLSPLPTDANFVLVPVAGARKVGESLRNAGIAVRVFEDLTGVGPALRITIGPWPMMDRCLSSLAGSIA
ncbi:MAG: histidinol-phosphate transaminase [Gemmatimonadaceae bacterium]